MADPRDPFRKDREKTGVHNVDSDGENVSLVLRLKDVRKTAKDWETFSSDNPLMCVLHSEAHVRSVRQLPLEVDPPDHTDFRKLVEPLFRRPTQPDYIESMEALIDEMVAQAVKDKEIEAVRGFALPLQSRALTRLLNVPESEAALWISWGVHVFRDRDDNAAEGPVLETYTAEKFKAAEENPGDDFFSILNQAEFRGRKLTFEEKQGYANIAFAGGRDTVIHTVSTIFAHLGEHPEALDFLREDPARITTACEEFVRFVSPLTAIMRVCPHGAKLGEQDVPAGARVGLCWPSANRDDTVFEDPDEVKLDRSPNPHVGFGFGPHNCLGAPHARLIIRSLLKKLCERVARLELVSATPKIEEETTFDRQAGYDAVNVRIIGK